MEDDSVRVLDKCMLDGHFDETKEKVLKKLQQDVRHVWTERRLDQRRHRRKRTDRSDTRHHTSQEALSALSEKTIEEAIERLEKENPTHWMTDRNVFEKVKQDVEYVPLAIPRSELRGDGNEVLTDTLLRISGRMHREKIMRAVDVEVWTTLEAPEQREEILRQVEEALGSILLRR